MHIAKKKVVGFFCRTVSVFIVVFSDEGKFLATQKSYGSLVFPIILSKFYCRSILWHWFGLFS